MDQDTLFASFFSEFINFVRGQILSDSVMTAFAILAILTVYTALHLGWQAAFSKRAVSNTLASYAIFLCNLMFIPIVYFLVEDLQSLYNYLGIPSLPQSVWDPLPFWLIGIIAIIANDFADYWNHRAMHHAWVWPIHAVHHSDTEVNALTTFRIHILESLFMRASYIVLLSWMGISPEAAGFGAGLLLMHNCYVHSNLNWDHGPFKFLIASPRFHRWHHANEPVAFGKNLANLVPAYDYIFGTYIQPKRDPGEMGADGVPDTDVVALMAFPIKEWFNIIAKKVSWGQSRQTVVEPIEPAE